MSHSPILPAGRTYHRGRRRFAGLVSIGNSLFVRAMTRSAAAALLFATIGYGLWRGDHLDAPGNENQSLMGVVSSIFGYSAQTIRIGGLKRQPAQSLLAALAMAPGSSLIGFDPAAAKRLLENLDWVDQASVRVVFPNQLEIEVVEREPFAIWQRDGRYYVIDRTGAAMGMDPGPFAGKLLLVSGEGAQAVVFDLVNQLAVHSALKSKVVAAARAGGRRWTLYFANNLRVALPEQGMEKALKWLERVDAEQGLLGKGISLIDMRIDGRVVIVPQSTMGKVASAGGEGTSD